MKNNTSIFVKGKRALTRIAAGALAVPSSQTTQDQGDFVVSERSAVSETGFYAAPNQEYNVAQKHIEFSIRTGEWTEKDERQFVDLAAKSALNELPSEERVTLEKLREYRRHDKSQRSYQELVEETRFLEDLKIMRSSLERCLAYYYKQGA